MKNFKNRETTLKSKPITDFDSKFVVSKLEDETNALIESARNLLVTIALYILMATILNALMDLVLNLVCFYSEEINLDNGGTSVFATKIDVETKIFIEN
ncbi:hypothetical protein MHBO_000982 [Bonamia ostreae]|uniref:Uncharacterized protein n=1 Tax=Bonamia ostreae TaxID=126728 RepID=A0ABV2AIN9_9EUKA